MSGEKLSIELLRYGRVVMGKILEQPHELAGRLSSRRGYSFRSLLVSSCSCPELTSTMFYVRGTCHSSDDVDFYHKHMSEDAAKEKCRDIKDFMDGYNKGEIVV